MLSIHVLWKIKQLLKCGLFAFQSPAFYLHPGWPYMFISGDIMWIKKAGLQIRLCASAVTAWPVSSMQHPSFFGAMASEGFLMWIILLPSSFECLGYVQSVLEGTGGVLLCNQEMCWCLYTGCQAGYLQCCFYLQWKEDLQLSTKTLWQRGHFGSSAFWSGGRAHAASWCLNWVGAAGAEKQLALANGDSCPKCPGLWSLISRGCLWLSLLLGSSSYCQ